MNNQTKATLSSPSSTPTIDNDDDGDGDDLHELELSLVYLPKPNSLNRFPGLYVPPRISLPISRDTINAEHHAAKSHWRVWPRNLQEKLLGDVLVAAAVTAAVAPFLTVIDKALVQYSVGSHTLKQSATQSVTAMVRQPVQYFKSPSFLWMWATYASTYTAANALRTVTEHHEHLGTTSASTTTASIHKNQNKSQSPSPQLAPAVFATSAMTIFLGTTAVNTTASLLKDRAYAKLFGNPAQLKMSVPAASYGLWMLRDFTTIGSSFILPTHVAGLLQQHSDMSAGDAQQVAQLVTPVAAQLVAGPLHYVGLDCYNRPLSASSGGFSSTMASQLTERARFLYRGVGTVVGARMARILPGYGIGGVWNTKLRSQWREALIQRQVGGQMLLQKHQQQLKSATTTASNNTATTPLRSEPSNNTMRSFRDLMEL
jgi:hypothetical protein